MRKITYNALELYKAAHKKVKEAYLQQQRKRGNLSIAAQVVEVLIKLEINALLGLSAVHKAEAVGKLYNLQGKILQAPEGEITAAEVNSLIELLLTCLENDIIPNSSLVIGSDKDQRNELERISKLLEDNNLLEEGAKNE